MKNKIKKENKFVKSLYNKKIIIPEEWEIKKIEDSCNILDYKRIPINSNERKKIQGNYPYYDANGIQDYVNDYIFDEELILLAEDGGCFEEYETRPIAQYVDKKCWVNNHAHVLTAKNNNFLKWIFYSLIHKNIIPYINGSTRAKLNQYDLKQIKIFIPPPLEQQKIASILSNVDALIESTQKLIEKTKRLKIGLMQQLLTHGIGHIKFKKIKWYFGKKIEIPEEWKWEKLEDCSSLKGRIGWQGLTTNEYRQHGQFHLVTGTDFKDGKIDWDNCVFVDEERYLQDTNIQLKNNDLLVTKDGTIGKIAYIDKLTLPATLNSGIFVIRPLNKKYLPIFLYIILNSDHFTKFINRLKAGSTINHLYQKDFIDFYFPIPSFQEQQKIASILSGVDAYIQINQEYKEKLERLKKGLMQNLLTGKIRVKT